jgi:hypothetical protein
MHLYLTSEDPDRLAQLATSLDHDLQTAGLAEQLTYRIENAEAVRGEPVTTAMIILAMASAGGALTVAVSKGGFLTQLAEVLKTFIERDKVEVTLETKGKKIALSGSGRHIEKLLTQALEQK